MWSYLEKIVNGELTGTISPDDARALLQGQIDNMANNWAMEYGNFPIGCVDISGKYFEFADFRDTTGMTSEQMLGATFYGCQMPAVAFNGTEVFPSAWGEGGTDLSLCTGITPEQILQVANDNTGGYWYCPTFPVTEFTGNEDFSQIHRQLDLSKAIGITPTQVLQALNTTEGANSTFPSVHFTGAEDFSNLYNNPYADLSKHTGITSAQYIAALKGWNGSSIETITLPPITFTGTEDFSQLQNTPLTLAGNISKFTGITREQISALNPQSTFRNVTISQAQYDAWSDILGADYDYDIGYRYHIVP